MNYNANTGPRPGTYLFDYPFERDISSKTSNVNI